MTAKIFVTAQERYRTLFENMTQGVFYMDADGLITDINPAAVRMLGIAPEDFVGRKYYERNITILTEDGRELPPEEQPSVEALLTGLPVQDKVIGFLNPTTGSVVWLLCNAIPLKKDLEPRPEGVFITFHDITERIKTSEERRIEKDKLKAAIQMGSMANWEFDFATRTFSLNDSFYALLGTSIDREKTYQVSVESLTRRFLLPPYHGLMADEMTRAITNASPEYWRELEFQVRRIDGEIRQFRTLFKLVLGPEGQAKTALGISQDITENKQYERRLRESEERLKLKLDSILNPGESLDEQDLRSLLDIETVQKMLGDFADMTGIAAAIGDTEGNLLVAVGFQDICQKFHRVHPGSLKNCVASDSFIAQTLKKGEYAAYKCKNQLWDVASPIYIGDKHIGNIYIGQFFYNDEEIDLDIFREQALWYDFDPDEYMAALKRVPRFSRQQINTTMDFLVKFADMISSISSMNIRQTRAMVEQKRIEAALKEIEERFERITSHAGYVIYRMALPEGRYEFVSGAAEEITGYSAESWYSNPVLIRKAIHPAWLDYFEVQWQNLLEGYAPPYYEYQFIHKSGMTRWLHQDNLVICDNEGWPVALESMLSDITERKETEEQIASERARLRSIIDSLPEIIYVRDRHGAFAGCNQAFRDISGCEEDEIIGRFECAAPLSDSRSFSRYQDNKVIETGQESSCEEWLTLPDGREVFLRTRKMPYTGENGQLMGMFSISHDLTISKERLRTLE